MKARIVWLLCIVMLMPGCIKYNNKQKPFSSPATQPFGDLSPDDIIEEQHDKSQSAAPRVYAITDRDAIAQYEAKISDIPLPLYAAPLSLRYAQNYAASDAITLEYRVDMPHQALKTFYEDEMERLGWHHERTFGSLSYSVYFTKPDHACALLIEPWNGNIKRSRLLLFLDV